MKSHAHTRAQVAGSKGRPQYHPQESRAHARHPLLPPSATADGTVQLLRFDGGRVWSAQPGGGGALSLDWGPGIAAARAPGDGSSAPSGSGGGGEGQESSGSGGRSLLAVGSMDGSVCVLNAATGALLARARPHSKYVVRAAFGPCGGGLLATASFDQTCCLLRLVESSSGDGGGNGEVGAGSGWGLQVVRQVCCEGAHMAPQSAASRARPARC